MALERAHPARWVTHSWHATSLNASSCCAHAVLCFPHFRSRLDLDSTSLTGTIPANWPDVSTLKNISILLMNNELSGGQAVHPAMLLLQAWAAVVQRASPLQTAAVAVAAAAWHREPTTTNSATCGLWCGGSGIWIATFGRRLAGWRTLRCILPYSCRGTAILAGQI